MLKIPPVEKPFVAALSGLLPLPWPLLAVTLVMLTRGWYGAASHRGWRSPVARRSLLILAVSTAGSVALGALRFAGNLGPSPL
jgi:hypothetical protein